MKHALVTGGAGFIGSHLVDSLLADGWRVTAFDNFDPFYDPAIKEANIHAHLSSPAYALVRGDLRDAKAVDLLGGTTYDVIVHLAAKAGVGRPMDVPAANQTFNVTGQHWRLDLPGRFGTRRSALPSPGVSSGGTRACRGVKTITCCSRSARTRAPR